MGQAHRYEVIGDQEVDGVGKGGTVELDPDVVNIPALVQAGHVRPASRAAEEAAQPGTQSAGQPGSGA